MTWLVLLIFFLIFKIQLSTAVCPPPEVVKPCECKLVREFRGSSDGIMCRNYLKDLKSVFQRISVNRKADDQHFYKLELSNLAVEELENQVIGNLTFESIAIFNDRKLKKVHPLAFESTASTLKYFYFYNLFRYSLSNLFEMLNTFVNVNLIFIADVNITHVPANAFKPLSRLDQLTILNLQIPSLQLSVAENAFFNLKNLTRLTLGRRINYLPSNAFKFTSESNQTLYLILLNNKLNSSSFNSGWLNNINRPVAMDLWSNEITFLNRSVFQPFLDDGRNNQIYDLKKNPLNCTDCRNAWLKKGLDKYKRRVSGAHCNRNSKGPTIFDSNFDHCPNDI